MTNLLPSASKIIETLTEAAVEDVDIEIHVAGDGTRFYLASDGADENYVVVLPTGSGEDARHLGPYSWVTNEQIVEDVLRELHP